MRSWIWVTSIGFNRLEEESLMCTYIVVEGAGGGALPRKVAPVSAYITDDH